jgi:hypothetical protein
MGFLPLFITRPSSTYQYSYITDQEAWNTAQGPGSVGSVGSVFEISLNCVLIVARLRQNLGVAVVSRFAFYAILGVAMVSRFASKCRDRLESFYCRANIARNCDILFTIATPATPSRHHRDTCSVAMFWSIERLIPMLLGDRSREFTNRDTFPDF